MVQKLETIEGGGESIRVGMTGTITSLMKRELDSIKFTPHQMPVSSRTKPQSVPVFVPYGGTTPRRLKPRKSSDEASSSYSDHRRPEITCKNKSYATNIHRIPMFTFDRSTLDRIPSGEKNDKNGSNIVEIVDIRCGNQDRAWASPIANRLKKLGFSKLSESII